MKLLALAFCVVALAACGDSGDGGADGSSDAASAPDRWHGCADAASAASCLPYYPSCPSTFDGACSASDGGRISVGSCGPYVVWAASGKDTTETVYYDGAGNVVAVTNESPVGDFCVAGPSDFTPPPACELGLCDGG